MLGNSYREASHSMHNATVSQMFGEKTIFINGQIKIGSMTGQE